MKLNIYRINGMINFKKIQPMFFPINWFNAKLAIKMFSPCS